MDQSNNAALKILAGGITAMAIALGISRFAFTPILPLMQQATRFGDGFAGFLGSANYAGYLAGACWAVHTSHNVNRLRQLKVNLALTIASTWGMGLTSQPIFWMVLRFLSGATSALVFVLASGIVLDALAVYKRPAWTGWLYAGVGFGIILSAVSVPLINPIAGWQGSWIGLAAISLVLAIGTWYGLPAREIMAPKTRHHSKAAPSHRAGLLVWLTVAYGLEGLGYIITATFLVSWLQRMTYPVYVSYLAWLVVGIAAVPSCFFWTKASLRIGSTKTLMIAYLVQALGILLPLCVPALWGVLGGAVFFGGTFLGIAGLSLVLGRDLAPNSADRAIAILTVSFGFGQMIGPAMAGALAVHTQGFTWPLLGASGIIVLGALCMAMGLATNTRFKAIHHKNIKAQKGVLSCRS